jgi:hypothetical protein
MLLKYDLKVIPVMHTLGYRHLIYLDTLNVFGCGPNAMISFSVRDKSKCQVLSTNFTDYLVDLAYKFESGYFFSHDGILHTFPANVTREGGSVTITEGLKIEAVS